MERDIQVEQRLSREDLLALKNKRAGLFIFQLSWILVFVVLILVNLRLRYSYPSWPPPGVEKLGWALPTLATLGLLASAVLARRARIAIEQDQRAAFMSQWRMALGLGAAFVLIMAYEWAITSITTQYGMVFRVMTGFHAVHALAIGALMFRIYRNAHQYSSRDFWLVEAATKLWYFVTIAWMMFYVVLYWT